jgi:hypothetical protein
MTGVPLLDWIEKAPAPLPDDQFDGENYEYKHDHGRLRKHLEKIFSFMLDGTWRTLDEISSVTGCDPKSVGSRVRDLRKEKFGGHTVERQRRGDPKLGIYEYRLTVRGP